MKKLILYTGLTLALLISFFTVSHIVKAQSCGNEADCKKLISEYEQKLVGIRDQKNTLSSQIEFADTQIYLTTLRIQDTERKISQTADEVESLKGRIVTLNSSLDYLSKLLLEKIVESYKRREPPFLAVFIDPDNASTMINRLKYAKVAEENDRKLAFQVQQAKLNFEQQKDLREDKQIELAKLSDALEGQKIALNGQKAQKQKLLTDTQSDEFTYQRLLAQAQAQLSGFRSFVQTAGASSVIGANSLGNGSDGNYYSQRDERWANRTMGYSSENVLNVGCLITSTAMVAKKYGDGSTPGDLAADANRFYGNTAYVTLPWRSVGGRSYTPVSNIDQELQNGNYVIVGVGGCGSGGSHFVVLTKKDGDSYIMHDPIYGPDKKFSDYYSNICSSATFK
ncbi:MAG: hypothetical protein WAT72_04325 [Microgenomates group bacterium]